MEDPIVSVESETQKLSIYRDETPDSPRNWDEAFTMVTTHRHYSFAGEGQQKDKDFTSSGELQEYMTSIKKDIKIVMPLYIYDHSGIALSVDKGYPFNDQWDAGQLGFVFITKERFKKEWGRATKKNVETAMRVLRAEISEMNDFLSGNVYGWVIEEKCDSCGHAKEVSESCWGYYGDMKDWIDDIGASKDLIEKLRATL